MGRILNRSDARDGGERARRLRTRPHAEERLVERGDKAEPRIAKEDLDERAAHRLLGVRAGAVTVHESAKRRHELRPLTPVLAEQDGGAHRGGPWSLLAAEQ